MFPALFRGELVGQLASFGGQTAAGGFFRVVELLLRGAVRPFHNNLKLPFPGIVVKTGQELAGENFFQRLTIATLPSCDFLKRSGTVIAHRVSFRCETTNPKVQRRQQSGSFARWNYDNPREQMGGRRFAFPTGPIRPTASCATGNLLQAHTSSCWHSQLPRALQAKLNSDRGSQEDVELSSFNLVQKNLCGIVRELCDCF